MARFLSEDKLLLQKRKRWQSLIRKEDSYLNFSQIREQVDPSVFYELHRNYQIIYSVSTTKNNGRR